MPMLPVKIAKKRKGDDFIVQPGLRDNTILPSSGGSSASGITLDYSAVNTQGGGFDNGVPWNYADDEDERERMLQEDQDVEMYDGWRNIRPGIEILPVNELLVSERAIARVLQEIQEGRPSYSLNKPLLVREVGGRNKKVLEEGHHRLVQGLIHGLKFFPVATMDVPEGTFGFSQAQQDPFVFEDTPFGGLERFADEDTLKQLASKTNFTNDTIEVNEAEDLYSYTRETPSSLTKEPTDTAQNSYVGHSEEGFPFRHNLDYGSTVRTAGTLNLPQYSDLDRYNQSLNPRNEATPPFDIFETHFTDDEVETTEDEEDEVEVKEKKAYPDYAPYEGMDGLYEYVMERNDSNTTPSFDIWNVYYVDDDGYVKPRKDKPHKKEAFVKTAVNYDSNPVIQNLVKIPEIKSLLDQQASGYVDEIKVTTPSADVAQTQQKLQQQPGQAPIKLEQPTGSPYGHVWVGEDPTTHQKKPLDRIVRIDRVTDAWGTLVTIIHEISHHRHPDWGESQVQSEAERLASTVKQYLEPKNAFTTSKQVLFVKNNLDNLSMVKCAVADTFSKQVIGLQHHSSLRADAGMVFPYPIPSFLAFHMGTVKFPIDIVFADKDNKIIKICRNCQPGSTEIYSCANASKVIEVVGSFCAFHDIDIGDRVFEADDKVYKQENFIKYILNRIQEVKIKEQKHLNMEDWNIRIVLDKDDTTRKFMRVDWSNEDYNSKKAELIVYPNPILIRAALKKMSLGKLVRHALLHILAGKKEELPDSKEHRLITKKLFKEARAEELAKRATNKSG